MLPSMLGIEEVERVIKLSRVTIWRKVRANEFPAPLELSANSIGWPESTIAEWIESRPRRTYGEQERRDKNVDRLKGKLRGRKPKAAPTEPSPPATAG